MDPHTLAPLFLIWDALAVLGILSGLVLALAGYRVFEQVAQLPGLILGVVIAGGLAYLLRHDPLPTIAAAAIGGWAGAAIIRAQRAAIIFASGAWVGLLVAVAIAALLAVLMQQMPAPSVLVLLLLVVPVVGGFIAWHQDRLMITLATAFTGAGLIVGGLARLSTHASGSYADANLPATMLLAALVLGVVGVVVQYRVLGAKEDRADGTESNTRRQRLFKNQAPARWDRPRPVILPKAINATRSRSADTFKTISVEAMAVSSDGSRLAVGAQGGAIYVMDTDRGRLVSAHTLPRNKGCVISCLAVARYGNWVYAANNNRVYLLSPQMNDVSPDSPIKRLFAKLGPSGLALSKDERWLATASLGSEMFVAQVLATDDAWPILDVRSTGERGSAAGFPDCLDDERVHCVAFHPRGEWLAVTTAAGKIYFYNPASDDWFSRSGWLDRISRLLDDGIPISPSNWSRFLSCGSYIHRPSKRARKLGITPERIPLSLRALGILPFQLVTTDDGTRLAVLAKEVAVLFDVMQSGESMHGGSRIGLRELQRKVAKPNEKWNRIALSPDGRFMAATSLPRESEGTNPELIHIWSAQTGRALCELTIHEDAQRQGDNGMVFEGLVFHPNGHWLFSGGMSGLIRRWALTEENGGWRATCDMAMEALPEGNWVVWRDPDGPNRCWVDPTPEAQRWLGWRMPSGSDFAEYRPFDAFKC